jgi:hypothetical protein
MLTSSDGRGLAVLGQLAQRRRGRAIAQFAHRRRWPRACTSAAGPRRASRRAGTPGLAWPSAGRSAPPCWPCRSPRAIRPRHSARAGPRCPNRASHARSRRGGQRFGHRVVGVIQSGGQRRYGPPLAARPEGASATRSRAGCDRSVNAASNASADIAMRPAPPETSVTPVASAPPSPAGRGLQAGIAGRNTVRASSRITSRAWVGTTIVTRSPVVGVRSTPPRSGSSEAVVGPKYGRQSV